MWNSYTPGICLKSFTVLFLLFLLLLFLLLLFSEKSISCFYTLWSIHLWGYVLYIHTVDW